MSGHSSRVVPGPRCGVDSLHHTLTGTVAAAQGGGGTQVSAARFGRFLFVRNLWRAEQQFG